MKWPLSLHRGRERRPDPFAGKYRRRKVRRAAERRAWTDTRPSTVDLVFAGFILGWPTWRIIGVRPRHKSKRARRAAHNRRRRGWARTRAAMATWKYMPKHPREVRARHGGGWGFHECNHPTLKEAARAKREGVNDEAVARDAS